jgi:hypothetical protein
MTRACTIALLIGLVLLGCGNNKRFNSDVWLKADMRERGRMSENLVKGKTLIGKSNDETRRLLGEPEKDWGRVIQYNIDMGLPLKDPKHTGLQVHLDENHYVREVRIVD